MSFQDDLMRADAIREIRASGCTLSGVAELIADFHGAVHVLTNVPKIQTLGEEVAASDTVTGAKMRAILRAQEKQTKAGTVPAQLEAKPLDAFSAEAIDYLVSQCGQTAQAAKEILERDGVDKILDEKKRRIGQGSSSPAATPAGNAPAAADMAASAAAVGNSEASGESTA